MNSDTPTPRTDSDDRSYPLPEHLQLIQFEGATVGVIAPEEYEELFQKARTLERENITLRNAQNACSDCDTPAAVVGASPCSASDQNEFETLDEAWNALIKARSDIARLRNRLGEHDGCSRWGVKDAIAMKEEQP